jgi:hypothetical protein
VLATNISVPFFLLHFICISGLKMANSNMIALTKLLPPRSHHSLNPQSERYTKEKYIRYGDVLSKETIPSVCF